MIARQVRGANISRNDRTRELREHSTRAERILWSALRDRRLAGFKIRRQYPIGPFFTDFTCVEKRLVIELDGAGHDLTYEADVRRTAALADHGYRVIRFNNDEVERNLEGVLQMIRLELKKC